MFIGLMGVDNNGKTLISPKGKNLFSVPFRLSWKIQRIQHIIAKLTWR